MCFLTVVSFIILLFSAENILGKKFIKPEQIHLSYGSKFFYIVYCQTLLFYTSAHQRRRTLNLFEYFLIVSELLLECV